MRTSNHKDGFILIVIYKEGLLLIVIKEGNEDKNLQSG